VTLMLTLTAKPINEVAVSQSRIRLDLV